MIDPKSKRVMDDEGDDPVYEPEMGCEFLRTWQEGNFLLRLWDTNRVDSYHKSVLAYELYYSGELIFQGADFCCSPMHAVDSDQCLGGILTFLSLRPGDVDSKYFDSYTPKQMEFARSHGEELSYLAMELEEKEEE